MAIKYGYPAKSRVKLIVRRTSCENELKKLITTQDASVTNNGTKGSDCPKIQVHKFVMNEQNAKKGKSLLATENISSGSVVLTERPYVAAIHSHLLRKYCYHCLRRIHKLSQPFPCLTCHQVAFCSGVCSTTAYSQYHRIECCYISILNISDDFHFSPKITLKAILKRGVSECLSSAEGSAEDREGYNGFLDLIEHPDTDKNDYSLPASIITAFLLEKNQDEIFTRNIILRLFERIIKHLRQVNVNGISITAKEVTVDDNKQPVFEEHTIGCGVYLTARFINHSCDPNTRIVKFQGDQVFVQAVRDIEAGEEITFSYGGNYKWQLLSTRKNMLRESYFFECNCSACEQGLQPITNALLCPECKGPIVSDKSMTCIQCKRVDNVDLKTILADTSACLKVVSLGTGLMDNPPAGVTGCDMAIKTLTEARSTLSQIVYKTHTELWKVDQKLVTCFLKDKRYEEAVEYSHKVHEYLVAQYDRTYYRVFNSLLSLVQCQVSHYQQLKLTVPLDKNKINIVKTATHKNLDLLQTTLQQISEGEDHAIRQRICESRKLLCLSNQSSV